MTAEPDSEPELVLARATIRLAGLSVGQEARIDPADPYMAACLKAGYLVPVAASEPPAA